MFWHMYIVIAKWTKIVLHVAVIKWSVPAKAIISIVLYSNYWTGIYDTTKYQLSINGAYSHKHIHLHEIFGKKITYLPLEKHYADDWEY